MVQLDFTSDSCAVLVWASAEEAANIGGAIAGSRFECVDDEAYALVGLPWDDALTDTENDRAFDISRAEVEAELAAAGVKWMEVA